MSKHFFSIGYRCSSASLLKHIGVKNESYPFDWMVSRLSIIKHCIDTDFKEFIDRDNYVSTLSSTSDYPTWDKESRVYICDEKVDYNTYYQYHFEVPAHSIPEPLSIPDDAYAYKLMMNHRKIQTEEDYQYYQRCIERWKTLMVSKNQKTSLYVHPALSEEKYIEYQLALLREFIDFHEFMRKKTANYSSIFIIPVRTSLEYPITQHKDSTIERIETDIANFSVFLLWTNKDFIDAGEIFMGNMWIETDELFATLREHILS